MEPASLEGWLTAQASMTRTCLDVGLAQIRGMRSALAGRIPRDGREVVMNSPDDDLGSILRHAEDVLALTEGIAAQARRTTANIVDMTLALCGPATWDAPSLGTFAEPAEIQAPPPAASGSRSASSTVSAPLA